MHKFIHYTLFNFFARLQGRNERDYEFDLFCEEVEEHYTFMASIRNAVSDKLMEQVQTEGEFEACISYATDIARHNDVAMAVFNALTTLDMIDYAEANLWDEYNEHAEEDDEGEDWIERARRLV